MSNSQRKNYYIGIFWQNNLFTLFVQFQCSLNFRTKSGIIFCDLKSFTLIYIPMISFDNNFYALDDNSWILTKKKDDKKVEIYKPMLLILITHLIPNRFLSFEFNLSRLALRSFKSLFGIISGLDTSCWAAWFKFASRVFAYELS